MAEEEKDGAPPPPEAYVDDPATALRQPYVETEEEAEARKNILLNDGTYMAPSSRVAQMYKWSGERVRVGAPHEKPGEPTRPGPSWLTGDDPIWRAAAR